MKTFKDLARSYNIPLDIITEERGIKIKNNVTDVNWSTFLILSRDRTEEVNKFIEDWILNELCIKNIESYNNIIDIYKNYPDAHVYFGYKDNRAQEFYFDEYSFEYNDSYTNIIKNQWSGYKDKRLLNDKVREKISFFQKILGKIHPDTLIINKKFTWYIVWNYKDLDDNLLKNLSKIIKKYTKDPSIIKTLYLYKKSEFKFVRLAFSERDPSKLNIYFKI